MNNNYNNNRRRPRRNKDFQPDEKLQAVWDRLHGYGVYTQSRRGDVYDWAKSRKQCNLKLAEAQKSFGLAALNSTKEALLGVPEQYNGLLGTGLSPINLKKELQRVQLTRTICLTADQKHLIPQLEDSLATQHDERIEYLLGRGVPCDELPDFEMPQFENPKFQLEALLDHANLTTLRELRGQVRDRIWGEERQATRDRIAKAKAKVKNKAKKVKRKGKGGNRKRNNNRSKAKS